MPPRFLYIIGAAVTLAVAMSLLNRRKRTCAWKGVVTEIAHQRKNITRDEDRGPEDWVTILYRTDEGAAGRLKLRMRLFRQFYPGLKPGDRLIKDSGVFYPDVEPAAVEAGSAPGE